VGTVQSAASLQDRCEWVMVFDEGNGFVSLERLNVFGVLMPLVPPIVTACSCSALTSHRCSVQCLPVLRTLLQWSESQLWPCAAGGCLLLCTVYVWHLDFWKCKGGSRWMVEELYVLSRFSSGNIWSISVWCSL
jgi:hypothetical protein